MRHMALASCFFLLLANCERGGGGGGKKHPRELSSPPLRPAPGPPRGNPRGNPRPRSFQPCHARSGATPRPRLAVAPARCPFRRAAQPQEASKRGGGGRPAPPDQRALRPLPTANCQCGHGTQLHIRHGALCVHSQDAMATGKRTPAHPVPGRSNRLLSAA
jgi:hypothetical protein